MTALDKEELITDEQLRDQAALRIYREARRKPEALTIPPRWNFLYRLAESIVFRARQAERKRFVVAHEGKDDDFGCPLFQHVCGRVEGLSLMESSDTDVPATGRVCETCGEKPEPIHWRLLYRRIGND